MANDERTLPVITPTSAEASVALPVIAQSVLLGIPYIGSALERAVFGASAERRQRRLEQTLREVGERLEAIEATASVESDQFVRLLESVAEPIASSVTNERRARFRDLLVNAAAKGHTDAEWEEALLAADLLERIADPGLEIIATIYRHQVAGEEAVIVFDAPARFHRARREAYEPETGIHFRHSAPLIEEWTRRLGQLRVVGGDNPVHLREPGRSRITLQGQGHVALTALGELIVRWAVDTTRMTTPENSS